MLVRLSQGTWRYVPKNIPPHNLLLELFDYKSFSIHSYLTIALTAASPSTATTTTPAGAAIVALSEVRTVLAIV